MEYSAKTVQCVNTASSRQWLCYPSKVGYELQESLKLYTPSNEKAIKSMKNYSDETLVDKLRAIKCLKCSNHT